MKWVKIASVILAIWMTTAFINGPSKLIIDGKDNIKGTINKVRASVLGKRFWYMQLEKAQKELYYELYEYPIEAEKDRAELQKWEREWGIEERKFDRENPELRMSRAEKQAEALRAKADEIETLASEREWEVWRQEHIVKLRHIAIYVERRLGLEHTKVKPRLDLFLPQK